MKDKFPAGSYTGSLSNCLECLRFNLEENLNLVFDILFLKPLSQYYSGIFILVRGY